MSKSKDAAIELEYLSCSETFTDLRSEKSEMAKSERSGADAGVVAGDN